jgi:hypothetical protein
MANATAGTSGQSSPPQRARKRVAGNQKAAMPSSWSPEYFAWSPSRSRRSSSLPAEGCGQYTCSTWMLTVKSVASRSAARRPVSAAVPDGRLA